MSINIVDAAKKLSRNPLGIIALFIVLVYGLACAVAGVAGFATGFTSGERLVLVWFIALFPVLILGVFAWLVSQHSTKLYAPSDYKDEKNYVHVQTQMRLKAVAAVTSASIKRGDFGDGNVNIDKIVDSVMRVESAGPRGREGRRTILWVDDRPENNVYGRKAFESFGIQVTIELDTEGAMERLQDRDYSAIISDMGRREGPQEGYVLLDAVRSRGNTTPFFFYAGSNSKEHRDLAISRGAQGSTNSAEALFEMVTKEILRTN